jgi:hypothetical protein
MQFLMVRNSWQWGGKAYCLTSKGRKIPYVDPFRSNPYFDG